MLKLFVHSYSFYFHYRHRRAFDVFAFLERAAAAGFSGVNVSAYGPNYVELSGAGTDHIARVRDRLASLGLLIDIENNGTAPDHLRSLIELAGRLGARNVRTYTRPPGTPAERVERAIAELREAARFAESAGIRILLENHEDLTGTEVATVLDRVASPWVCGLFDYGNSMVFQEDPMTSLAAMLPWIRSGHMKDHVMLPARVDRVEQPSVLGVPLGQGNLPIVDITQRLIAAGVERVCFENVWGYRTPLRDRRGHAALGVGAFAYAHPPYDPARCYLDAKEQVKVDATDVLEFEDRAFGAAVAWLKTAFEAAHIKLARPLAVG